MLRVHCMQPHYCRFDIFIEQHKLGKELLKEGNRHLAQAGVLLREGTIVDETSGVIHSLATTAANTHDITQTAHLLHGQEATCWGDAGYLGVQKRKELADTPIDWRIAARVGTRRQMDEVALRQEHIKASVRANSEYRTCEIHRIRTGLIRASLDQPLNYGSRRSCNN